VVPTPVDTRPIIAAIIKALPTLLPLIIPLLAKEAEKANDAERNSEPPK
jgi:hypothetical protein